MPTCKWKKAQEGERRFWEENAPFVRSPGYREKIRRRAARLGEWVGRYVDLSKSVALELGGGGTQLLDFLPAQLRLGADPLAHFYQCTFGDILNPEVLLVASRGEELPFPNAGFNIIICRNVLDHVDAPQSVLLELIRVLRSGGILYLSLNTLSGPVFYYRLIRPTAEEPHPFSPKNLSKLVRNTEFTVIAERFDDPEELEHYFEAGQLNPLRAKLRRLLVTLGFFHFSEFLLKKESSRANC